MLEIAKRIALTITEPSIHMSLSMGSETVAKYKSKEEKYFFFGKVLLK